MRQCRSRQRPNLEEHEWADAKGQKSVTPTQSAHATDRTVHLSVWVKLHFKIRLSQGAFNQGHNQNTNNSTLTTRSVLSVLQAKSQLHRKLWLQFPTPTKTTILRETPKSHTPSHLVRNVPPTSAHPLHLLFRRNYALVVQWNSQFSQISSLIASLLTEVYNSKAAKSVYSTRLTNISTAVRTSRYPHISRLARLVPAVRPAHFIPTPHKT